MDTRQATRGAVVAPPPYPSTSSSSSHPPAAVDSAAVANCNGPRRMLHTQRYSIQVGPKKVSHYQKSSSVTTFIVNFKYKMSTRML